MDSQPRLLYPAGCLEGSSGFKDVTAALDSKRHCTCFWLLTLGTMMAWNRGVKEPSEASSHFVHLTFTGLTWATLALCPQPGLRAEPDCSEMIQRSRKNCLNQGLVTV